MFNPVKLLSDLEQLTLYIDKNDINSTKYLPESNMNKKNQEMPIYK